MKVESGNTTPITNITTEDAKNKPETTGKTNASSKTGGTNEDSLVEVKIDNNNTTSAEDRTQQRINQWKQQLQNLLSQLDNLRLQEQALCGGGCDASTLQNQLTNINNQRNTLYDNINTALINLSSLEGSSSSTSSLSGNSGITGLGTTSNFSYRANAAGTGKATIENARQFDDKNASQMKKIMQDAGYLYHENAWCADFVGFAIGLTYGKDNAPGDFFKTCPGYPSCGQLKSWAENNGSWTKDASTIQAGDLVIFDWDGDGKADHVGLYISNNGKTVHTIEGNTSGAAGGSCVEEKDRSPSTILGFIRLSGLK